MNKQAIIDALRAFTNQRPGFDLGNYATMRDYRSDYRKAQKDRTVALQLLRDIELRDSISAEDILAECGGGRLQIEWTDKGQPCPRKHASASKDEVRCRICCGTGKAIAGTARIDYCAGQYWCVEYRAAVARLCASVLWTWKREQCMPEGETDGHGNRRVQWRENWLTPGDWLRASFRREYGKGIAGRFFS